MATDFTVLSDSAVQTLFRAFTEDDVHFMADALRSAFHAFSNNNEDKYQLHRSAVARPSGRTTLFMPSTLEIGSSVKMVGVPAPGEDSTLRCTLTICDNAGQCIGIINAGEFTAFRTSLGAILGFERRKYVYDVVIFGAGKQAFWHVRLAIILRSKDISRITIFNRSAPRAEQLVERIRRECGTYAAHIDFVIFDDAEREREPDMFQSTINGASVIFCTTPSTTPLFTTDMLLSTSEKTRYISAIGSYKLDMQEIDPEHLKYVVADDPQNFILVDGREAAYLEAGEIVKAGIKPERLMEMGELVEKERIATGDEVQRLTHWLEEGDVIYKSVGLGIMDLALGKALLDLARQRGIGVRLEDF